MYIYFYMHFFFSKSISRLFTTLFFLHYFLSDTMCATVTCGGELFFVMCIRRTKKSFTHKKERVFSALHKFRLLDHWYLFFPPPPSSLSFSLSSQSSEVSTMLFLLLLLLLSSTPQRPKAREFFVFSFLCALLFFRIF